MKKIINILLVFLLGSGFYSCTEDYLELSDPNALSPNVFPTSMEHMDLLLNAIYADQHSFGLFGHDMLGKNIYAFDHSQDMAWTATQFWNEMTQNNTRPSNDFMSETWRDTWRGVQHSNNFLQLLPEFEQNITNPDELARLKLMEGQVYFMRAWFYQYLVGFWGETFIHDGQGGDKLGVPIITTVADSRDAMLVERSTVKEVWDFIISDLKQAETILAGHVWTGADEVRVNEWAVKGFLGKAYVYTEEWDNAKPYLEEVINNSGKSLVPFDTFKNMFNGENEKNQESLFEISLAVDKNTWGAWGPSAGSGVGMVIGPCFMGNNGGSSGSGWSNVFPHDKNLERFGFNLDVPAMVDNPDFDANEPVSIDNLDKIPDPEYVQKSMDLRTDKTADPRLYVATLQPYIDSMFADNRTRPIAHYKDVPAEHHAWSFRKYVSIDGNEYSKNVNNNSNFYWLRMADVYLLYAETLIEKGDAAGGLEYLNKVKRRAYGFSPDAPSAVDYTSLTDNTIANDAVLGNDPLKYERWAELFGEGHWWFDVCRWKIGSMEADVYQKTRGGTINWDDSRSYAQPIPLKEMESNPLMLQNPGYL